MKEINVSICVYFFMAFTRVSATDIWNYFEANEIFDGKTCNEAGRVFKTTLSRGKTECLKECMNHVDCVSAFHVQQTDDCTGCRVGYDNMSLFSFIEPMNGSKYYEIQSIIPPIYNLDLYRYLGCPAGWMGFFDSCYFLVEEWLNFQKGVEKCHQLNADAVKIQDESENNNIKAFLRSLTFQRMYCIKGVSESYIAFIVYTTFNAFLRVMKQCRPRSDGTDVPADFDLNWSHLSKAGKEVKTNVYDWAYFTAYRNDTSDAWTAYDLSHTITFENWAPDQPTKDNTENCLVFFLLTDFQWIDSDCSDEYRMICEKKRN